MYSVINHIRVGSYLATTYAALLAVVILNKPSSMPQAEAEAFDRRVTIAMLVGLAPIAALGFAASYFKLALFQQRVLRKFRTAAPGSKVKDIYRFKHPHDVEIVARVARTWVDDEILDPECVKVVSSLSAQAASMRPLAHAAWGSLQDGVPAHSPVRRPAQRAAGSCVLHAGNACRYQTRVTKSATVQCSNT